MVEEEKTFQKLDIPTAEILVSISSIISLLFIFLFNI